MNGYLKFKATGPYDGERGGTYWITESGDKTYTKPADTSAKSGDTKTDEHRRKSQSLLKRVREVPGKIVEKVSTFVKKKYAGLSERYGPTGAKLVMGGIIALLPVPLPGSSLIPIAIAEGVHRVRGVFASQPHAEQFSEMTSEELAAEIRQTIEELYADAGEPIPELDDAELLATANEMLAKGDDFEAFAGGWTGPYKGERGGTYWLSPTGKPSYDEPSGGTEPTAKDEAKSLAKAGPAQAKQVAETVSRRVGGFAAGIAGASGNREADTRLAGKVWDDSASGLDPTVKSEVAGHLNSIASDPNAASVGSKIKGLVGYLAKLPLKALGSVVKSIGEYAKGMLRGGLRVAGAVGLHLGAIALSAGIIAAATLLPAVVPPAVAILAAFPIGYGVKRLLTKTGTSAGNILDPQQQAYHAELSDDFSEDESGFEAFDDPGDWHVTKSGKGEYSPSTGNWRPIGSGRTTDKGTVRRGGEIADRHAKNMRTIAVQMNRDDYHPDDVIKDVPQYLEAATVAERKNFHGQFNRLKEQVSENWPPEVFHSPEWRNLERAYRDGYQNAASVLESQANQIVAMAKHKKENPEYKVSSASIAAITSQEDSKAAHGKAMQGILAAGRAFLDKYRIMKTGKGLVKFAEPTPTDQVALAGPDGKRAAELLGDAKRKGMLTLYYLSRRAAARLLDDPNPEQADTFFDEDEMQVLTDSLAAVTATANLLGRSRIRERADQAEKVEQGVREYGDDDSFELFRGGIPALRLAEPEPEQHSNFAEPPPVPLQPENAINYFQRLVPTLNVPGGFVNAMGQQAFTMAAATDAAMLNTVKGLIVDTLRTGDTTGRVADIRDLLDAAGVTPRNPQYSEMVYRTNMMQSYNTGAQEEMDDPLMQEFFPVWQYAGILDGRQGADHQPHFDKYYPSSAKFEEVRGDRVFNCRCTPIPVSKYQWRDLQANGVKMETEW